MIEKLIANNHGKICLIVAIFIMWCFFSIVKQGGGTMPSIEALEIDSHNHKQWAEEFSYRLRQLEPIPEKECKKWCRDDSSPRYDYSQSSL